MMTQIGFNIFFPKNIETWKYGDPVPEWLSDVAEVKILTGDGVINLETRSLSNGGYEILESGKTGTLVKVGGKDWYVCKDCNGKRILSLSPEQLELLYKEK